MTYDYTCTYCGKTFEVSGVTVADRFTPQTCTDCEEPAVYNSMASITTSRVVYHEGLNTFLDRKFGRNPTWQPPKVGGGISSEGKGSVGAMRYYPGDPKVCKREI